MKEAADNAITLFEKVFDEPGNWDMFIPKYIEVTKNTVNADDFKQLIIGDFPFSLFRSILHLKFANILVHCTFFTNRIGKFHRFTICSSDVRVS